ncbi:hypothetical protein NPA07_02940 [Mycoplasmopsis caviae]|uniref:Uncharacterized protein n=1 Tax=Mycoplasmopsis caviae TaxID=55603 RepID=A0A3P8KNH3_9BACT|nr:hypothetical protein [Mycoplasmopsis caviae]UUD34756.1 hypothetical protein NPA07_02940 [Mycoplasmopsis caviae]VDR41534.1 Uncharacterised protein [Mycoplasmopsis caviae]VDR42448.1 Uncharacterised protein [Mycoplasmopsis caviae]VDR42470.1 Uncharacterised protein [Mycoplasmopsis caviae]VDR42548.1 Uncharacterised protein [Mycoplasmopsis caviae]
MEKLKLQSEWNEVEEFAKQSSEDLTNLKSEQYISKRNEVIDSFIKIKTHINKLRKESIKLWDYGKHRLNAFKTSYENVKSNLDTFNAFGFSYSTISDQLENTNTFLSKDHRSKLNTATDLTEFLSTLNLTNELLEVDFKNYNSIKSANTSNVNNKLSSAIVTKHNELEGYKQLIELSDARSIKDEIETKNNSLQATSIIEWEENNYNSVKSSFDNLFKSTKEINTKAKELDYLRILYNDFLDNVSKNVKELSSLAEPHLKGYQRNIDARNKIITEATK